VASRAERREDGPVSERDLYGPPPEEAAAGSRPLPSLPPLPQPDAASHDGEPGPPAWAVRDLSVPAGGEPGLPGAPDAPEQELGGGRFTVGLVVAVLAAAAGGLAWGLVMKWTGYDLDASAWGVGILVGLAVRVATGRRTGELQVVAVVATLLGVLLGKYLVFAFDLQDQFGVVYGVFSGDTLQLFRDSLGDAFGTWDFLWIALGAGSAWLLLLPPEALAAGTATEEEYHTRNPVDRLTRRLPRSLRITVDWIVTIVGAVAIVLLVKAFVVNPYRIPSSSMEPTLHCARPGNECEARFSDRVLANRFIYHFRTPQRGEIVVFTTPPRACGVGGTFVKRVIGLPGEKLEVRLIRGDGYVFINGKRLDEPYIREDRRQVRSSFGPITVPKDHYFMMGDNRESSCDSRDWGSLPRKNLIGKVFATYWPPQRLSLH
jgi:signal peptidase I